MFLFVAMMRYSVLPKKIVLTPNSFAASTSRRFSWSAADSVVVVVVVIVVVVVAVVGVVSISSSVSSFSGVVVVVVVVVVAGFVVAWQRGTWQDSHLLEGSVV